MSITDELRGYVQNWRETPNLMNDLDAGDIDGIFCDFEHIADRIDAEHERTFRNLTDALHKQEDATRELDEKSVLLPVDADGEYIRIGDMMDSKVDHLFDGRPFEVRALVLCEGEWEAADGRFGNRYEPNSLRHHHAPTVEDVLSEMLSEAFPADFTHRSEAIEAMVAEYAAKLQLKEDE